VGYFSLTRLLAALRQLPFLGATGRFLCLSSRSSRDYERGVEALNRGDNELAIACFDAAIRLNPDDADALLCRGLAYHRQQNLDKAIEDCSAAIRLDPTSAKAYARRGLAYDGKREPGKAISDFTEAIRIDPNIARAYVMRGVCYVKLRETEKAIQDCTTAIRLAPNDPAAYTARGVAYADQREYDRALQDYTAALRLASEYLPACEKLAWLRATCPRPHLRNGSGALECVRKVSGHALCESAPHLETLAAVHAENGQFEEAVRLQRKALAKREFGRDEVAEARMRLRLYQRYKPYRERDRV
jgi:tetratricopeptide (TPR) repeat protein